MKKLNQELDTTFIFSTHDPEIAPSRDHVIRLQDGRIVEEIRSGRDRGPAAKAGAPS